jgi:mannosyltransferase
MSNNKYLVYLISITLLGFGLRFYHLDFQSLWLDELYSMIGCNPNQSLNEVINYCKGDQPPSFFILLFYAFKVFGYTPFVGRLLAAVIGTLGIPVIYFLGKEVQGKTTGLVAAFITSFNYYHIFYSQEVRFYSLLFLLSALSYLFFIRISRNSKLKDYVLYVIFTTLLLYTHYYGLVVFASQGLIFIILLLQRRYPLAVIVKSAFAGLTALLLFSPWIPQVMNDSKISEFWIGAPSPLFLFITYFTYFTEIVQALIFAFLIYLFFRFRPKGNDSALIQSKSNFVIITGWVILGYLIPAVYTWIRIPILFPRYTIIVLPAIILMIAIGLSQIGKTRTQNILIWVAGLSSLVALFFVNNYYTEVKKEQWREITIATTQEDGSHYLYVSEFDRFYNFYFQNLMTNHTVMPVSQITKDQLDNYEGVWVIYAHSPVTADAIVPPPILNEEFKVAKEINLYKAFARLYLRRAP